MSPVWILGEWSDCLAVDVRVALTGSVKMCDVKDSTSAVSVRGKNEVDTGGGVV